MADYIAVNAIDGEKDGKRHEYAPGDPITVSDDDERKLLAAGAIREPSEAETALIEKRLAATQRTASPVKKQTEPPKANGPGGASGVIDDDDDDDTGNQGGGSVATDTNTVGAGPQGDKDSSQPQGTTVNKTDGSKDGKTASKGKTAGKGKSRDNDLA